MFHIFAKTFPPSGCYPHQGENTAPCEREGATTQREMERDAQARERAWHAQETASLQMLVLLFFYYFMMSVDGGIAFKGFM